MAALLAMATGRALIPMAVRVALRSAVGGNGPYSYGGIVDLFNAHEFTARDRQMEEVGGVRRTAAESFHARIDWSSPEQAQHYLDLVADVLDLYPSEEDQPGTPGRVLRRALEQGGFVAPDGRLRLPGPPATAEPDVEGIWKPDRVRWTGCPSPPALPRSGSSPSSSRRPRRRSGCYRRSGSS